MERLCSVYGSSLAAFWLVVSWVACEPSRASEYACGRKVGLGKGMVKVGAKGVYSYTRFRGGGCRGGGVECVERENCAPLR